NGCRKSNHRSNVLRLLGSDRAGDDPSQAVPDQVDLAAGFLDGLLDRVPEAIANQQVWTLCIQADTGKVGLIADAFQPGMQMGHIKVGSEKSGNDHDRGPVAMWYTQTVIDG